MTSQTQIKRALISVADKRGVIELAKTLINQGVEIIATGGTANLLRQHNVPTVEVAEYTGFPEIMQGRVKTLHPKIFAGLLGRRVEDADVMADMAIAPIDLVIVNLYPFYQTIVYNPPLSDAIEQIDIGGVSLIRAAAKNFSDVYVVVDPNDYPSLLQTLQSNDKKVATAQRLEFAKKAFAYTAWYDGIIANYFGTLSDSDEQKQQEFPDYFTVQFTKSKNLRYGENPHQKAALYQSHELGPLAQATRSSMASATQLQGKELSYNNISDADTAYECVQSFVTAPACVIVKHANPCGVAMGATLLEAYQLAYRTDPTSAFGGIIAFNQELDAQTAQKIIATQFVEVIIAPSYANAALTLLASKPLIRVLQVARSNQTNDMTNYMIHRVDGGALIQTYDGDDIANLQLRVVSQREPSTQELTDLIFAWQVAKYVKSNAIVFANKGSTLGIGAGQMSRIYSGKIAAMKANDEGISLIGSVMASDAFFPFRDTVDTAAVHGVTAIIQPGGSIRDEEVINAADQSDIAMVFTGIRHFRH